MTYTIGYQVVKVRGNTSYVLNVYKTKELARTIADILAKEEYGNTDLVSCTYKVEETKVY